MPVQYQPVSVPAWKGEAGVLTPSIGTTDSGWLLGEKEFYCLSECCLSVSVDDLILMCMWEIPNGSSGYR